MIGEINPGVYVARARSSARPSPADHADNAQRELYLTDVVALAAKAGGVAHGLVRDADERRGHQRPRAARRRRGHALRAHRRRPRRGGATIRASARIDAGVVVEPDATLEHGVVLRGATRSARRASSTWARAHRRARRAGANVKPYTIATTSSIGERAQIGPFAHLRPESEIEADAHVGNFVETKKTVMLGGREGEPPRVPRRRRDGRGREHRRGHDLLQLRRLQEAQDRDRRGRLHRQATRSSWPR
jgi:bifunctional UDP-N-acetylglucosamine pyrophosphorylase/glucosamine-1-phosphate N-acetyltransferase